MLQNWPGPDEKSVIAEMINDIQSSHWRECDTLIRHLLSRMNAPVDSTEDIVQLSLLSVKNNLANFRYECPLKFWIARIAANKMKDVLRVYHRDRQYIQPIDALSSDTADIEIIEIVTPHTVEDQYIQREQLQEIIAKLRDHVAHHAPRLRERDTIILHLTLFEGYTCDEVAQQLGIKRPVVYQVVRKARLSLRKHQEE